MRFQKGSVLKLLKRIEAEAAFVKAETEMAMVTSLVAANQHLLSDLDQARERVCALEEKLILAGLDLSYDEKPRLSDKQRGKLEKEASATVKRFRSMADSVQIAFGLASDERRKTMVSFFLEETGKAFPRLAALAKELQQ